MKSDTAEADGDIAIARRTSVSSTVGRARIMAGSTTKASLEIEIGFRVRPTASTPRESNTIGAGARRISIGSEGISS